MSELAGWRGEAGFIGSGMRDGGRITRGNGVAATGEGNALGSEGILGRLLDAVRVRARGLRGCFSLLRGFRF